jgi:probable rRNA maturation factor
MTDVAVSGLSVPRLSRREIAEFTRKVLLTLEKMGRLEEEITDVSIAFVDDAAMTNLNRKFRKKVKTTDILTFPADDSYNEPTASGRPLGDIVISIDRARGQAFDEKHSLATEIRYLLVHGMLHALGYDHETDNGQMNALEEEVRSQVGLA